MSRISFEYLQRRRHLNHLGQLFFQTSVTPKVKVLFLMFTWNFQCSSLCLLSLVLSVGTTEVQGCNSTHCPASFTQDPELYYLTITAAKVISSLHIPNQTFFVSRRSSNTYLVGLTTTCVRKLPATLYRNLLNCTCLAEFLFDAHCRLPV